MMSNLRIFGRLPLPITMVLIMVGSGELARAQENNEPIDDDIAPPVRARAAVPREQAGVLAVRGQMVAQAFNVDQMDQWVFGSLGGSAGARNKLDSSLVLRIQDLERTCNITEGQKNKLRLAGRGDIKRFFDKVEAIRRKFQQGQNDPNNIWQEIQPLTIELNSGLFGDDSLYGKTIRRTLSPDQTARFESLARERKALRFRATVEWFVTHLDKGLGLTDDDRRRFVELLVNEARPPRRFGQVDYWYMMLQTARLPEAKLKPIFDAPQWRLLSRQFAQARAMAQRLKATGVLVEDDEDEKGAVGREPAIPRRPAVSVKKP
jgi:hypothetical protein